MPESQPQNRFSEISFTDLLSNRMGLSDTSVSAREAVIGEQQRGDRPRWERRGGGGQMKDANSDTACGEAVQVRNSK